MRRTPTDEEFEQQFARARHSAWRWEQQPVYDMADERADIDAFLAGHPVDPRGNPFTGPWLRQVAELTAAGVTIGRVRIVEEPPTDYQRWLRWVDRHNRAAGERIDYLTRSRYQEIGPPPFAPKADWWLVDDESLLIMNFAPSGQRTSIELLVDEPEIEMAVRWRERVIDEARRDPKA